MSRVDTLTRKVYDFHISPNGSRIFALNLATDSLQIHDSRGKLIDRIAVGRVPKNDPRAPMTSIAPLRSTPDGQLIVLKSGVRGEVLCIGMDTLKVESIEIPHGLKARDCVVTPSNTLIIDAVRHLYVIDLKSKKEIASG